MLRILIAGCGYVGQATADLLHGRGWSVEGWTASAESAGQLAAKPYAVRAVNITNPETLSAVRGEFDVIMQCASSGGGEAEEYRRIYLGGARNLLHAFPGAKLLFTSSTSVYAQQQGDVVDETSPANPGHEKGQILRETEELVLSHNGIVARLGGIYGPGRSFLLRKFLAGEAMLDREDDRFINQAHRDDIASGLVLLAEQRASLGGEIYNVVDDQPILARDVYQWLSKHLQRPLPAGRGAPPREKARRRKQAGIEQETAHSRMGAALSEFWRRHEGERPLELRTKRIDRARQAGMEAAQEKNGMRHIKLSGREATVVRSIGFTEAMMGAEIQDCTHMEVEDVTDTLNSLMSAGYVESIPFCEQVQIAEMPVTAFEINPAYVQDLRQAMYRR